MSPIALTLPEARRIWSRRQGLDADAPFQSVPGGWTRALGGVDPYLALRARQPDLTRADVDRAMGDDELFVTPGVRGCIWVVPRADAALALVTGDAQYRKRTTRDMAKLGVPKAELDGLGLAVMDRLRSGPLSPDELRARLPAGAVRNLGAEGKNVGHTTTLPAALRFLEGAGKLIRRQQSGRLDSNRYRWARAEPNLLELGEAPATQEGRAAALARRFWSWAAPATTDEFIEWSGLGKRVARAAAGGLELVPVLIQGGDGDYQVLPSQVEALREPLQAPPRTTVDLLPAQDNLLTLRGRPACLAGEAHHDRELLSMGGRTTPLKKARWIHQRPIAHDGEWIGLWAWDRDTREVLTAGFGPLSAELQAATEAAADSLTAFIADELDGVAKQNAIDSDSFQRKRAAALRALIG